MTTPKPPCDKCWGLCCKAPHREVSVELKAGEREQFPEAIEVSDGLGGRVFGIPNVGGQCMHLGDDNRCTIYDRRPQLCREFNCLFGFRQTLESSSFLLKDHPELVDLICEERPGYVAEILKPPKEKS